MSVGRICVREVYLADANESVADAARRMKQQNVGTLVVLDEDSEPIGIVTDRDLALRVVAAEQPASTEVRKVMSQLPDVVDESTSIESGLAIMRAGRHRRLPIVDSAGKLVGILSLNDILELLAEEFKSIGELLAR